MRVRSERVRVGVSGRREPVRVILRLRRLTSRYDNSGKRVEE